MIDIDDQGRGDAIVMTEWKFPPCRGQRGRSIADVRREHRERLAKIKSLVVFEPPQLAGARPQYAFRCKRFRRTFTSAEVGKLYGMSSSSVTAITGKYERRGHGHVMIHGDRWTRTLYGRTND